MADAPETQQPEKKKGNPILAWGSGIVTGALAGWGTLVLKTKGYVKGNLKTLAEPGVLRTLIQEDKEGVARKAADKLSGEIEKYGEVEGRIRALKTEFFGSEAGKKFEKAIADAGTEFNNAPVKTPEALKPLEEKIATAFRAESNAMHAATAKGLTGAERLKAITSGQGKVRWAFAAVATVAVGAIVGLVVNKFTKKSDPEKSQVEKLADRSAPDPVTAYNADGSPIATFGR